MKNHYHTLGILENAAPEQIKAAFKKLAIQYHPDKHYGDPVMEEHFKEINAAYQILSDPTKKAQFDLQLQYYRYSAARARPPIHQTYRSATSYRPRPQYGQRPINRKENNRATLYAFVFTFLIALLVMFARGLYDIYQQKRYEQELIARRTVFEQAQESYKSDHVRESLLMLSNLAPFKSEERDMSEYQSEILEEIIFKGEANYEKKHFQEAIRYYELVEQFSPYRPLAMKARHAQSYRYVHNPDLSIRMLKELIKDNYHVVATLAQIADIYRVELKDNNLAKDYLELARDVATNEYRAQFGKAYMVVITQEFIPYDHYFLFEDLANVYNSIDEPQKAVGATNWMKRVWPDSITPYLIAGHSQEKLNQPTQACFEYRKARQMGHSDPLPLICR